MRLLIIFQFVFVSLSLTGCGKTPVDKLISRLEGTDAESQYEAAKALEEYGAEGEPAVPALAKMLQHDEPKLRYRAAKAISKIEAGISGVSDELAEALKDENADVRYYAAKSLSKCSSHSKTTIAKLANASEKIDEAAKVYVAKALCECEEPGSDITDNVRALLKDSNGDVQYYAILTLSHIGPKARISLPELREILKSNDPRLKSAAELAIQRIGGSS
ncbi:MAG: HEAT repeat domain-containing protein [Planctomycetales bacterium]|nr:HEAT repeat domain-containing protein [Planctomycetales bacterium]